MIGFLRCALLRRRKPSSPSSQTFAAAENVAALEAYRCVLMLPVFPLLHHMMHILSTVLVMTIQYAPCHALALAEIHEKSIYFKSRVRPF